MTIAADNEIAVVTWIWNGERKYKPSQVDVLARGFARNLTLPYKFICISDYEQSDFKENVIALKTPAAAIKLGKIRTPEGRGFPSCYRRLWLFSQEAADVLGKRVFLIDVDAVIHRNIDHLFRHNDPFIGWRPNSSWGKHGRLAGGTYLMDTGAFTDVYNKFDSSGIRAARAAGFRGSDQAWISYNLYEKARLWDRKDGIVSSKEAKNVFELPNTCIVHFNGHTKQWHDRHSWTRQYWDM